MLWKNNKHTRPNLTGNKQGGYEKQGCQRKVTQKFGSSHPREAEGSEGLQIGKPHCQNVPTSRTGEQLFPVGRAGKENFSIP